MSEFEYIVGIDAGGEVHQIVLMGYEGSVVAERRCAHQGAELRGLVDWVEQRVGDLSRVAVAIESPRGGVVSAFCSAGVAVYSINPKQLDRFRDRFSASGSKDDRKDALVAADSFRTDRRHFTRVEEETPSLVELRELTRFRRRLLKLKGQMTNQLRAVLHEYWPELLSLSPAANERWLWALLKKAPRPGKARGLQKKTLRQLLREHRIRRFDEHELRCLLQLPTIPVSKGTLRSAQYKVRALIAQLELVQAQIKDAQKCIGDTLQGVIAEESKRGGGSQYGDAEIILSFPGAGLLVTATLLGEADRLLKDYQRLRCQAGVAPVTFTSGKRHLVRRRWACNRQLKDIATQWARNAAFNDPNLSNRYQQLRDRGHGYHRSLRQIADRLFRMLAAALNNRTLYDPYIHQHSLEAA
jgi:transposase